MDFFKIIKSIYFIYHTNIQRYIIPHNANCFSLQVPHLVKAWRGMHEKQNRTMISLYPKCRQMGMQEPFCPLYYNF